MSDEQDVLRALSAAATQVVDPESGRSVAAAGLVGRARLDEGALHFDLTLGRGHTAAHAEQMVDALVRQLGLGGLELPVVPTVVPPPERPRGAGAGGVKPAGGAPARKPVRGAARVIAVASGKGGVGKSTVAINLAVGLADTGWRVGLLDADVYGPSAPTMLGVSARPLAGADGRIVPQVAHGISVLSMGLVVEADTPVIWRGPMVMGAIQQLLHDAAWPDLDVLVVDLPPGTGDAQMTLVEATELAGVVLVTTPQEVALADVVRGIDLFQRLDVPLLGLVENMAYYALPDGTRDHVFGEGGGRRVAGRFGVRVLAELPLRTALRVAGDRGQPAVRTEGAMGDELRALARAVRECLA